MTAIIPDEGLEWMADKLLDIEFGSIDQVAVGTGTTGVSASDTSMVDLAYREDTASSSVTITETEDVGVIRATIDVEGGTDVPGGTEISEFGVFTDSGEMVYHEITDPITLNIGEEVTFVIEIDVTR